jgi:hypothetical protein
MVRHLPEILRLEMNLKSIGEVQGTCPSWFGPRPPPIPPTETWLKVNGSNFPEGLSINFEVENQPIFKGETRGGRVLVVVPISEHHTGGILAVESQEDVYVTLALERWGVALLGSEDVENPVRDIAWNRELLYTAGPKGISIYKAYHIGKLKRLTEWPEFSEATRMHFSNNWLLVYRPGELIVALAQGPGEVEIISSTSLDLEATAMATSMDGRLFMRLFIADAGQIKAYDANALPDFEYLGEAEDPTAARELAVFGSYLLAFGDNEVGIFNTEDLELHSHYSIGSVESVLPLDDSIVLRTSENECFVLDLSQEVPEVAGKIEADYIPDHAALRSPYFPRMGQDGLMAAMGENESEIRLYGVVQYKTDTEALSYYLE